MLKKEQRSDIAAAAFIALAFASQAIFQSIPSKNEASGRIPPISAPRQNSAKSTSEDQQKRPGLSREAPFYIQAECEHGCGYSEDDKTWFTRFRGDPNAFFALCVFGAALVQAWIARKQWLAIREANEVAEKAAQIAESTARGAEKAFRTAQRPWITVTPEVKSPLEWGKSVGRIMFRLHLKNVGKDPAFDVRVGCDGFAWRGEEVSLKDRLVEFCRSRMDGPDTSEAGYVIFPDATASHSEVAFFDGAGFEENMLGIRPVLFICVDYRSQITNAWHQTGKAFWIRNATSLDEGVPWILIGQPLSGSLIELEEDSSSSYAN
jgi:hypothetical protein